MNRFIEVFEKMVGKKVETHDTSLFRKIIDLKPIKFRKGKTRLFVSMNDLNSNGKLFSDYKERREQRRQKKNESKALDSIDIKF